MDRCTFREAWPSTPPGPPCEYPATCEVTEVTPEGARVVQLCDFHIFLTATAFRLKGLRVVLEETE